MPVRLPSGRARLDIHPSAIGSPNETNTIGIVVVASFTAGRAGRVGTKIASGLRLIRSLTKSGSRDGLWSAKRYSIDKVRPGAQPRLSSPSQKALYQIALKVASRPAIDM